MNKTKRSQRHNRVNNITKENETNKTKKRTGGNETRQMKGSTTIEIAADEYNHQQYKTE